MEEQKTFTLVLSLVMYYPSPVQRGIPVLRGLLNAVLFTAVYSMLCSLGFLLKPGTNRMMVFNQLTQAGSSISHGLILRSVLFLAVFVVCCFTFFVFTFVLKCFEKVTQRRCTK